MLLRAGTGAQGGGGADAPPAPRYALRVTRPLRPTTYLDGRMRTARLELVPATLAHLDAALAGPAELARALGAVVPRTWPHEFLDDAAFVYARDRLREAPESAAWWLHFVVLVDDREGPALVGSAGTKGPPDATGAVEIGYGIVSDRRRRGFATEAARALVEHAFADARVRRVIAETLPELVGSIGVLGQCGFRRVEGASEPGVLRFAITREEWTRWWEEHAR